jgi:putative acyl-CoA dehydrogenase
VPGGGNGGAYLKPYTLYMQATPTHTVFNQTPPLVDYDLWASDTALREAAAREGAGAYTAELAAAGIALGAAESFEAARAANRNPPLLHAFNVRGERVDALEFHPAWHELMRGIVARGYHCSPWEPLSGPAPASAHAARAAGYLMQAQVECGTLCPTTMTYGALSVMRRDTWLAAHWLPRLVTREYDPRDLPIEQKRGGLVGMGMTEKQGGSDVRANTTQALRTGDGTYRLTGHKWFFSAPQCDAHLVLAQSDRGLSCFFVPRCLPDGKRNRIEIQRLKDKLGNRSNASAEVEFREAWGYLVGEAGRGIPTILEMGTFTRLDCVIGSAGMMRQCVAQALHHARHRRVFGSRLIDQPLMRAVLADLAIESEAATALALRLARAFDSETDSEVALRRALTSAAKFWVCKRGCELAAEAMEVLGGNGYTEELPIARIAREMPVNSIWEGSGNIMCLDVLRAFGKGVGTRDAVLQELLPARGRHPAYDAAFERFAALGAATRGGSSSGGGFAGGGSGSGAGGSGSGAAVVPESQARHFTVAFVTLAQAAVLLGAAHDAGSRAVAEGFCATRLSPESGWGAVYGAGGGKVDDEAVLARAWG